MKPLNNLKKPCTRAFALSSVLWSFAIAGICGFLNLHSLANLPVSPPPAPIVHTCRTQIAPYSDKPTFEAEFDFVDRQFNYLPVVTKRQNPDLNREEIFVWQALYGSDGDYDYWTTPVLREYTLEKTEPLVIVRQSSRASYPSTAAKLNATLTVDFRRKSFPVSCTVTPPKPASVETSALDTVEFAPLYTCRAKVMPGRLPLFDVEFDYLAQSWLQKRYPYPQENIYVKVTDRFKPSAGQTKRLEARWGSDGDYSFWTTPVLRDVVGGTNPLVIAMEPGVLVRSGSPSLVTQLNSAFSIDFAGKSYPVKCS